MRRGFYYKIECPKCGAKVGDNCLAKKGTYRTICAQRIAEAVKRGLQPNPTFHGLTRPKTKTRKVRQQTYNINHSDGWKSYNCTNNACYNCPAKPGRCNCDCHKRGS